ncbi:MAG: hypothetical protein Q8R36_05315 [bacterium]|nr:hypothetical protein [bacterium]
MSEQVSKSVKKPLEKKKKKVSDKKGKKTDKKDDLSIDDLVAEEQEVVDKFHQEGGQ